MSDETISVLPRILDPSMKFTAESIRSMPEKNKNNNVEVNTKEINNTSQTKTEKENKNEVKELSGIYLFFNNYKYIILTIVILILLIILAVLVYRYYNKNKNNKQEDLSIDNNKQKIDHEKKQKLDEYISNYIIDDEENEIDEETNNIHEIDKDDTNIIIDKQFNDINEENQVNQVNQMVNNQEDNTTQNEDINVDLEEIPLLETNNNHIFKSNIISKPYEIVIEENLVISPDLNKSNENRFEEISETLSDTNESIDINDIIDELNNTNQSNKPAKKQKKNKNKNESEAGIDHFKAYINNNS